MENSQSETIETVLVRGIEVDDRLNAKIENGQYVHKWVSFQEVADFALARLSWPTVLQQDTMVFCYQTEDDLFVPEARFSEWPGGKYFPEYERKGMVARIQGVLSDLDDVNAAQGILSRKGDSYKVEDFYRDGLRGRMPQKGGLINGISAVPTLVGTDGHNSYPFDADDFERHGYPKESDPLSARRFTQRVRVQRVIAGGSLVPQVPVRPEIVDEFKLAFEGMPTHAITIAVYDPQKKRWLAQTLPYGELSENVWKRHYPKSFITGSRAFINPTTGRIQVFRLDEHIKRALGDAKEVGCNGWNADFLQELFAQQLSADRAYISEYDNKWGNGCYARLVGEGDAMGPGLYGPSRRLRLCTTPLGPYRDDMMLNIRLMGRPRPLAEGKGQHKLGTNYYDACMLFAPFKGEYHECIFVQGERLQEGTSVNYVVILYGQGDNGKDLVITPPLSYGDVLPGINCKSVMQLTERNGTKYDVRFDEDVCIKDLSRASDGGGEVLVTGTAMSVRGVKKIMEPNGQIIFMASTGKEMGPVGADIKTQFDQIFKGTHPDPELRAWMQDVVSM